MKVKKAITRASDGESGETAAGFSAAERAAMQERAAEVKAAARKGSGAKKDDGEAEVLAKIAEMPEGDRVLAQRIHVIVKANAPELKSKTWYGMPAYAKDGDVVCFFQSAHKFKTRYATLGFSDKAKLDEGNVWPSAFALHRLTEAEEKTMAALVKRAVGRS